MDSTKEPGTSRRHRYQDPDMLDILNRTRFAADSVAKITFVALIALLPTGLALVAVYAAVSFAVTNHGLDHTIADSLTGGISDTLEYLNPAIFSVAAGWAVMRIIRDVSARSLRIREAALVNPRASVEAPGEPWPQGILPSRWTGTDRKESSCAGETP